MPDIKKQCFSLCFLGNLPFSIEEVGLEMRHLLPVSSGWVLQQAKEQQVAPAPAMPFLLMAFERELGVFFSSRL